MFLGHQKKVHNPSSRSSSKYKEHFPKEALPAPSSQQWAGFYHVKSKNKAL